MSALMMPTAAVIQGCFRILGNFSGRGCLLSGLGFCGFGYFGWARATSLYHSSAVGRGSTMSLYHSLPQLAGCIGSACSWVCFLLDYGEMGC